MKRSRVDGLTPRTDFDLLSAFSSGDSSELLYDLNFVAVRDGMEADTAGGLTRSGSFTGRQERLAATASLSIFC